MSWEDPSYIVVCISVASYMSLASCKKRKHANEMSQTTLPTPKEQPSLLSLALILEPGGGAALLRKRKGTNWIDRIKPNGRKTQ